MTGLILSLVITHRIVILNNRAGVQCEVRGASLQGGKMRGTVRGISARCWVICEAGMCEAQRTTGAAGVVLECEPLKRN